MDADLQFSGRPAFDKITGYITRAKQAGADVIAGGTCESHHNNNLSIVKFFFFHDHQGTTPRVISYDPLFSSAKIQSL